MTENKDAETNADVKAKYLEALQRKSKAPHGPTPRGPESTSGAHGEHAAEGSKREFRRKSGG